MCDCNDKIILPMWTLKTITVSLLEGGRGRVDTETALGLGGGGGDGRDVARSQGNQGMQRPLGAGEGAEPD